MQNVYCKIVRLFYINEFITDENAENRHQMRICKCINTSCGTHTHTSFILKHLHRLRANFPIIFPNHDDEPKSSPRPPSQTQLIVCD